MKDQNQNNKLVGTGILAAIAASLCCITPVLALLAGTSGLAATFSWIEPFRPYLIVFTLLILALAWYRLLKPKTIIDCDCETNENSNKKSFLNSKKFLGIVTAFAFIALAFPYYSNIFYPEHKSNIVQTSNSNIEELTVQVKGMTCESCNLHVEHEVSLLSGYIDANADYKSGEVNVKFDNSKTTKKEVMDAINKTGYKIIDPAKQKQVTKGQVISNGNISFYEVGLVCNAAPSIGCGSRSKPVLTDLEKNENIKEAWLNRKGTVIAIVWNNTVDQKLRYQIIKNISLKNKLLQTPLSLTEYDNNLASFKTDSDFWLRGNDVDKLSREEAGIIANQMITVYKEKGNLSAEQEEKLRSDIQTAFYDFFLNFDSLDELSSTSAYRNILLKVIDSSKAYIDDKQIPEIHTLLKACMGHSENCTRSCCNTEI